jgi:thiol-disulfide isomerase/thioredoxin
MIKKITINVLLLFVIMSFSGISKAYYKSFNCDIIVNVEDSNIKDGSVFYLQKDSVLGVSTWNIIDSCVLKDNQLKFKTRITQPFWGIISLKNNDTLAINGFIFTEKPIRINWKAARAFWKNDSTSLEIEGGESDFIKENRAKFEISTNSKEIEFDIRNQISQFGAVSPQSINYKYWINYQKELEKWVANNSDKYYTLLKLDGARDCLSEKTIVRCLESLKSNYNNTLFYDILEKYVVARKSSLLRKDFINIELLDNKKQRINSKDIFNTNKELYIVDFGASWCGYCIIQARELNQKYESIDTTKIQIISISVDKKLDDWLKFEKKENYKWNSYLINNTFDKYGTQSIMSYLPTYYVLDKNKKIISKYYSLDEIPFLKLK